jgi:hypothetical protein
MMPRNILNVLTDAFDSINANEADFIVERVVHEQTLHITVVLRRPAELPRAISFQHPRLVFMVSRDGDVLVEVNELMTNNGLNAFLANFLDAVIDF